MKRIKELFIKLCSIKGIFFISCLVLAILGKLDGQMFFYSGLFIIGDRTLEKFLGLKK